MDIQPRNPIIGVVRKIALFWTATGVLGLVGGLLFTIYSMAWRCVGHHLGWFGCSLESAAVPFGALALLAVAGPLLFFAHLFFASGARLEP